MYTCVCVYIYIYIYLCMCHPSEDLQNPRTRGLPSGIIRLNWNDTEKISTAPAQG